MLQQATNLLETNANKSLSKEIENLRKRKRECVSIEIEDTKKNHTKI